MFYPILYGSLFFFLILCAIAFYNAYQWKLYQDRKHDAFRRKEYLMNASQLPSKPTSFHELKAKARKYRTERLIDSRFDYTFGHARL